MREWSISVTRLAPATLPARLAAFLLDILVGIGLAILFSLVAFVWLLWRSDAGLRQPSDLSIYVAILLGSASVPVWAGYSLICWLRHGQTAGLAAMSLAVADLQGNPPGIGRSLVRLIGVATGMTLLFIAFVAAIAAIAAAAQGTLPIAAAVAGSLLVLAALVDPACWALTRRKLALHDLLSGTRIVQFAPPEQAAQEFTNRVP